MLIYLKQKYVELRSLKEWVLRRFEAPTPPFIKRKVILRLGAANASWVETGTYLGDTTSLLANHSSKVYSVEPDLTLFNLAKKRFLGNQKIEIINGVSEEILPQLLPKIKGNVNFWLDGHYSGGITHKGLKDCPVIEELNSIEQNLHRFESVVVLIDDVRCFNPSVSGYEDYPDINHLIEWARKNNLYWSIEHDIFVATTIVPVR